MSNLIDKPIGYEYDEEFTNKLLLSNVHERAIYYEQLMDKMKQQFVEQACEITEVVRKRAEYGYSVDSAYDKGLYQAAVEIQQAIKDKFK